ncbi:hypothetical protein LTR15_006836 [Elasticomyces elasticus]|nr:hypothetical protein LTR15_006836 [Elasticomyces elasticus]
MKTSDCPGLKATLRVDGASLREYALDEDEDESDEKRYVEVVAGSEFSVGVRFDAGFPYRNDAIAVRTFLDGQYATGLVIVPKRKPPGTLEEMKSVKMPKTDDSKATGSTLDLVKNMGVIRVECRRGTSSITSSSTGNHFQSHAGKGIPEKCLKGRAISSQATTGAPRSTQAPVYSRMRWPYGKDTIAVFHFLYRSRSTYPSTSSKVTTYHIIEDLQIEGVIARSPTPVPLEERDPDLLTLEEARQLVRRAREREEARVQIKQEIKKEKRNHAQVDEDDPDVSFEGERNQRSRTFNDGRVEFVDLTDN